MEPEVLSKRTHTLTAHSVCIVYIFREAYVGIESRLCDVMLGNETESTISIDAENFRLNGFFVGWKWSRGERASAQN